MMVWLTKCERLINIVTTNKPNDVVGFPSAERSLRLEPKGVQSVDSLS